MAASGREQPRSLSGLEGGGGRAAWQGSAFRRGAQLPLGTRCLTSVSLRAAIRHGHGHAEAKGRQPLGTAGGLGLQGILRALGVSTVT